MVVVLIRVLILQLDQRCPISFNVTTHLLATFVDGKRDTHSKCLSNMKKLL